MANIYAKSMRDALQEAREYRDPTDISEGNLSYDEWLKQVKGIEKGAHGINSDEHAKYSKEWKDYVNASESKLTEIVGGQGEMTITQDDKVLIIKTKDWQTYKAKGWQKKTNESLDLSTTGDTSTSNASQEVEGEELDEALLDKDGVDSMGNRVIYDKDGYRVQQLTKDGLGDMFVVISKYKRLLIGWSAKPGGNKKTAMKLTSKDKFKWKWGEHSSKYGGQAQGNLPAQTPEQLVAWLKKEGIKEEIDGRTSTPAGSCDNRYYKKANW
jgi:hypothetical protein